MSAAPKPVKFPSGRLTLEGIIETPAGEVPFPVVVLCHPHPLYGGAMDDFVIISVAGALHEKGIATLRFNFRGVGGSEGEYGGGRGERLDAVHAIDYLSTRDEIAPDKIGLAGYSFGGGVAASVALKDDRVKALALISPVIPDSGWKKLGAYFNPKLLVIGDADEYFPIAKYGPKIAGSLKPGEFTVFPAAGHFWDASTDAMAGQVAEFFNRNLI